MTMVWCSVVPVPAPSSMPSVISPCPSFACSAFILSANLSGARFNLNAKHTNRGRIQLPAPMCLYPVSVGTKAKMEPMKAVIVGASASWKGPQCELILNKVNGNRPKEQVFQQIDSIFARMHEEELKKPRGRVFCHADSRSLNDSRLAKKNNWKGIPTKLNNVPHSREIRQYFYEDVLGATARALEDGMNRLKVEISIPELNPDMDVYRIGTLMELVRVLALSFADDGKRIKVCVQGSMGEGMLSGMPLQLAGTKRILEFMDWGDKNVIGTFINIGTIGAREVTDKDDMFILVAPQNAMGNCIIGDLQAMVEAANPRPVIVINPRLKDMPSSGGVMQTIGRDKRLEFVASFSNSYHFRLLYKIGTQYPIMGALRMSYPYPYELYKRIDTELGKEKYVELATFSKKPNSEEINDAFDGQTRAKQSTPTGIWDLLNSIL